MAKRVADLMGAIFAVVFILALCTVIGALAVRTAMWIMGV